MSEDNVVPIEKAKGEFSELGVSGLIQYSGRVDEEFLKELQGAKAIKVYRQMSENDPVVGAILFAVDMLMRQVEWRVDPFDESPYAKRLAEFVESCLDDMSLSWSETLSSILSMLVYGWSYEEIVYKRRGGPDQKSPKKRSRYDDGLIGWRKFAIRSQDSLYKWEFDDEGGIQGMWQQAPPVYEPVLIPIEKALLFRTASKKNSPEGVSVLRTAYRPWFYKSRIEEIEAIGIERDLAGLPVAWVPATMLSAAASADEQIALRAIKEIVSSIKRDEQEGVIMPQSFDEKGQKRFDLQLLSTGGARQFDTSAVVTRYNQSIAMSVLADFIMLGQASVGSFALGASKMDMFAMALGAWLDEVAAVFNQHAIPRLLQLNSLEVDIAPTLAHADIRRVELAEVGGYLGQLAAAGMPLFPDEDLEDYLRDVGNLPERSATAMPAPPPPPPPMG
jgi:hypothetical protein